MLTEKYDFRITDQMTIPLRPHWIANDSYREKCKMLVLNRSKGEIHKVDFSKVTDYIKEGDVICFNDSTIINHMFICKYNATGFTENKHQGIRAITFISKSKPASQVTPTAVQLG